MSNTKINLDRQSDLILTSPSITSPVGIIAADIQDDSLGQDVQTTLDNIATTVGYDGKGAAAQSYWDSYTNFLVYDGYDADIAGYQTSLDNLTTEAQAIESTLNALVNAYNDPSTVYPVQIMNQKGDLVTYQTAEDLMSGAGDAIPEVQRRLTQLQGDIDSYQNSINLANTAKQMQLDLVPENLVNFEAYQQWQSELNDTANYNDLQGQIDNEVARAGSAEKILEDTINYEVLRAESVESDLSTAISTEASRIDVILEGSEVDLNQFAEIVSFVNDIDLENDNALLSAVTSIGVEMSTVDASLESLIGANIKSIGGLNSGLSAEISNRTSADASLAANLSTEVFKSEVVVSAEISNRTSADASLAADLSTESTQRVDGDNSLQSQIDGLAEVDGTTIELDTNTNLIRLKEQVAAPDSGIRTFDGLINVSSEPSDDANFTDLSLVTKGFVSAELSVETSRAIDAEAVLTADLIAEVSNRIADVDTEESRAIAAEGSLENLIGDEETRAMNAETSLQNNISLEASTRVVNDLSLESAMNVADGSLESLITSEVGRAESAETSLNAKIDFVISNTDPAALDSLTEIVTAFQSVDGDLSNTITNLSNTATANLSAEVLRAESAEAVLTSGLSTEIANREAAVSLEEVARISGDNSLELALSTEVVNRTADVDAEETRAMSVETILSSDLSAEVVRAESVESVISSNLSAEVVRAESVESVISSNLSAEVVRAESAEASLVADLSSEVVRAESAEASLGVRLDNLLANIAPEVIDSISEVLNTFYQKVQYNGVIDDVNTAFTPFYLLNDGSESVFLNGVLQDRVNDYNVTLSDSGKISVVTFINAPLTGDKVNIYGITNVSADAYINA